MKKYKLPDYALADYLAAYAGDQFLIPMQFVRDYPRLCRAWPAGLARSQCRAKSLSAGTIHLSLFRTPKVS